MKLVDLTISGKLTLITTASSLVVFLIVSVLLVLSLDRLNRSAVWEVRQLTAGDATASLLSAAPEQRFAGLVEYFSEQREATVALAIGLMLVGAIISALVNYYTIGTFSHRFIASPADRIKDALAAMERQGDFSKRVDTGADDELGSTVVAFNRGLDYLEHENNALNDSVIELLQVSDRLSRERDLTIRVPVKGDVTGPLSDALNRITSETAAVLQQVRQISNQVEKASRQVQEQGNQVVGVATRQREVIEKSTADLAAAVDAIENVATLAQFCHGLAGQAASSTSSALGSVKKTIEGMSNIRTEMQETGKRIKRLGERSQEINSIVDILNSFAERTHVLAINAAMQAATAGEAGRGFAVVAQEVQRLADSSRNATSQIASLIRNIQVETADTIATMNHATEAVGRESRTVEDAGVQMQETQKTTINLAQAVQEIYAKSQAQVEGNRQLMGSVDSMRASTAETTDQLDQQTAQTHRLVEFADQLLKSINLFKLPERA